MAKIKLRLKPKANKNANQKIGDKSSRDKHDGVRLVGYDYPAVDLPKSKVKSLLANQTNVQNYMAHKYPFDYMEKMHVSVKNWLGRMERERTLPKGKRR